VIQASKGEIMSSTNPYGTDNPYANTPNANPYTANASASSSTSNPYASEPAINPYTDASSASHGTEASASNNPYVTSLPNEPAPETVSSTDDQANPYFTPPAQQEQLPGANSDPYAQRPGVGHEEQNGAGVSPENPYASGSSSSSAADSQPSSPLPPYGKPVDSANATVPHSPSEQGMSSVPLSPLPTDTEPTYIPIKGDVTADPKNPEQASMHSKFRNVIYFSLVVRILGIAAIIMFIVVATQVRSIDDLYAYSDKKGTKPSLSKVSNVQWIVPGVPGIGFDTAYPFMPTSCGNSTAALKNFLSSGDGRAYDFPSYDVFARGLYIGSVIIVTFVAQLLFVLFNIWQFSKRRVVKKGMDILEPLVSLITLIITILTGASLGVLVDNTPEKAYFVKFSTVSAIDCSARRESSNSELVQLLDATPQVVVLLTSLLIVYILLFLAGFAKLYLEREILKYKRDQWFELNVLEKIASAVLCVHKDRKTPSPILAPILLEYKHQRELKKERKRVKSSTAAV
jgi:hypothetical protein